MARAATNSVTNTFTKGMNSDLDKSIRPNDMYLRADNFRVVGSYSDTTGALENVKGNIQITDGVGDTSNGMYLTNQYVIGTKRIQNWLVVWTTSNTANTEGAGDSYIYAFKIIDGIASTDGNVALHPTAYALYPFCIYKDLGNDLNLSTLSRIKAVASYEGEDVAKIYWCDGDRNALRWMNIFDSGLPSQTVDRFELIPAATLLKAEIETLTTGNLKSGKIQYTYQLFNVKGAESSFAPLSDLINLTADNENLGNSQHYEGSDFDVSTGKGVRISIDNQNLDYDFIRGIAIQYTQLNGVTIIRVFDERAIDSIASNIYLNDGGETLGTYELEEFSVLSRNIFKAEDLETKDNYLFAANIEENYFDVGTYDARAYRFKGGNDSLIYHNYDDSDNYTYLDITSGTTIDDYVWTEYTVTGGGAPAATGKTYTTATIPETYDCVNRYNDYSNDGTGNHQHKHQRDGTTFGASGVNIDVDIEMETIRIDHDFTRFPHYVGAPAEGTDPQPFYQQTESTADNSSYTGYASPYISSKYPGYMRDEIYRFGIVFYDDMGRRSFVRWICDLRMPHMNETIHGNNSTIAYVSTVYTRARILYPKFKVKYMPDGAVSYQIVRLKRDGFHNRNILSQGLLSANSRTDTDEYPALTEDSNKTNITDTENVWLTSPEIAFNKNLSYSSGDQLVVMASLDTTDTDDFRRNTNVSSVTFNKCISWDGVSIVTASIDVVDTAFISSPSNTSYNLGGANTVHVLEDTGTENYFKGTSLLIKTSGTATWTPQAAGTSDNLRFLCNYRRNNWLTQYGGNTYEDRSRNIYQACGDMVLLADINSFYPDLSGPNYTSFGGDTYINIFDYVDAIPDLSQGVGFYQLSNVFVPVESTINCDLRHDLSSINKVMDGTVGDVYRRTQETKGLHTDDDANEYDQVTDLYLYNTVYSQENITIPFIAKPVTELYSISDNFITRIKYSDRKIDGETSDSWFKFRTESFIDLEKEPGSINNIKLYKNGLYFWQDHAFGMLFINPRALLGTEEGSSLVLGTGGFLETADYISRTIGNVNKFGIVATDQSIYWVDNEHRDMIRFTGGMRGGGASGSKLESLSFEKGLSQYIRNRGYIADAQLAYDQMNKEIFVTLTSGRSGTVGTLSGVDFVAVDGVGLLAYDFVIVDGKYFYLNDPFDTEVELTDISEFYSAGDNIFMGPEQDKSTFSFLEKINTFGSFYSFTPGLYNDEFEYLITNSASDSLYLWCHEKGNRGQFYGTYYDSGVYVTFNPEFPYTKVFDNLLWFTEVIDESGTYDINRFNDTWDKVTFYNDYQNSKELTMGFRTGALPYDRRERGFSAAVPRSAVDVDVSDNLDKWTNTDLTQMYRERMRDKYLIGHFYYINGSANYRFICPYITMKYRRSIR